MTTILYAAVSLLISISVNAQSRVDIPELGPFCPNIMEEHLIKGDKEFGGDVNHNVLISFQKNADNILMATVVWEMSETYAHDYPEKTKVRAQWTKRIFNAPESQTIEYIQTPLGIYRAGQQLQVIGNTREAGIEFGFCNDGTSYNLTSNDITVNLIGDTGSDDVSDDQDCKCDSRINKISFGDKFNIVLTQYKKSEQICVLTNKGINMVLDGSAGSPNKVQLWKNLNDRDQYVPNAENQKWDIVDYGNGVFKLMNKYSKLVLDASAGTKGKVQLWEDLGNSDTYTNKANNQKWMFETNRDGGFRIRNVHYSDLYLYASKGSNGNLVLVSKKFASPDNAIWERNCANLIIQ